MFFRYESNLEPVTLIRLTPLIKYLRGGISTGNEVLSTSQFIVFPFPSVNCISLPLCRWVTLSGIKISKSKNTFSTVFCDYLYQMLDKRSGSRGGEGAMPPGPVKISHKKDGRPRRPHRFHVSAPLPPLTRPLDPLLAKHVNLSTAHFSDLKDPTN